MAAKKKTSSKKKTTKKKKTLKKVSPEVSFYFMDGTCCSDLIKLSEELDKITDDMFKHFVNEEKNDFANWIEHVFEEPALAKKLRKTMNKDRHVIEILRFAVKELE